MAFSSGTVTIGHNTKKSDYDRVLDNTQYNKATHSSDLILSTRGLDRISLSNFDGSGVPEVKSGSVIENNGTVLSFSSDQSINDSGVANGWVYIKYSVSNSRFEYTVTAPAWDDSKQGYYSTNDRYFFKMYKVGAADFRYKIKFKNTIFGEIYHPYRKVFSATDTYGDLFAHFDNLIPDTNDYVSVIAKFRIGTTQLDTYTGMCRGSATTILLYGTKLTTPATPVTQHRSFPDGNATALDNNLYVLVYFYEI